MLPLAEVSHAGIKRVRLRVLERRGDAGYFAQVVEKLAQLPGIERVEANPLTASVLVLPGSVLDALGAQAEAAGLFRLAAAPGAVPLTETVAAAFRDVNRQLTHMTGNTFNLASVGKEAVTVAARRGCRIAAFGA